MVNIYFLDLTKFDYDLFIDNIEEDKKESILKYKNENKKREKIASLVLLKKIFSLQNLDFSYGDLGKPYLKNSNFFFNVSHTKDALVIVKGEKELGIDIEKERNIDSRKLDLLNKKVSTKALNSSEFLKEWTIKESYLKLLGLGIGTNLKNINIDYENKKVFLKGYKEAFFETFSYHDNIISISLYDKYSYVIENVQI